MRRKLKYNNDPLFKFREELGISQQELAGMIGSTRSQIARQENGGVLISKSSRMRLKELVLKINKLRTDKIKDDTIALQQYEKARQKTLKELIKKHRQELKNLVFMQEDMQVFFEKTLSQYTKMLYVLELLKGKVDAAVFHDLTSSSRYTAKRLNQFSPAKQMKVAYRIVQLKTSIEWAEKQLDVADWMHIQTKES